MLPVDLSGFSSFRGGFAREHPLAPLTTWRIGGPAELYVEPADVDDVVVAVEALRASGVPYRVLGGGSNLLISDRGVRGAVISLARLNRIDVLEGVVVTGAGALLHQVVSRAADAGAAGLEALAGIPGRIGGAIFGNAGSRYGAIGDVTLAVDVLTPDGECECLVPPAGFFEYRRSRIGDRIVLAAHLATDAGDPITLRARQQVLLRERLGSQPGWVGNAGCVFKNPAGRSAGQMIDDAGFKSEREGGIVVSPRHANFFENAGGGTADDVDRLVNRVRDAVHRAHGVELEMEVKRWR